MRTFDYWTADTREQALEKKRTSAPSRYFAGGTDLLPLMKLGVEQPRQLIDLKRSDLSRDIEVASDGSATVGALATLAEIERHEQLGRRFTVLTQAAADAATPQIRHRATVGGNLLQRPRCWYFRNRHVTCWLEGGEACPARAGQNQFHALLEQSPCVAVHPSDLAPALLALDANIELVQTDGERELPVAELYAPPNEKRRRETTQDAGELVCSVRIPPLPDGSESLYLKAMDRKVWAFALVSVAAVRRGPRDELGSGNLRVALGGVANVPVTLGADQLRRFLEGSRDIQSLGDDWQPLQHNRYKISLVRALVEQAVEALS